MKIKRIYHVYLNVFTLTLFGLLIAISMSYYFLILSFHGYFHGYISPHPLRTVSKSLFKS